MSRYAHPYCSGSNNYGHRAADIPGMSTAEVFLAHILTGLASNPATMLDIESHLDYAIRMASLAQQKASNVGL